ncbi:GvpL/GvpF family gas vesicle protein [Isoptericola sp. NPDC055881]
MTLSTTEDPTVGTPELYLYGLVAQGTRPPGDLTGVDGQPVRVVPLEQVAALVSDAPVQRDVGLPDDVRDHARVLDAVAATRPVLPVRFGTLTTDEELPDAVPQGAQAEHAEALRALEGSVQLTVSARYREDAVLAELVAQEPEIRRLRELTRGRSEESTYDARMRLGELVVAGFERRRGGDEQRLVATVAPLARATRMHEVSRTGDIAELALLVRHDDVERLEVALEALAAQVADHMTVRLVGPQAPYDFTEEV